MMEHNVSLVNDNVISLAAEGTASKVVMAYDKSGNIVAKSSCPKEWEVIKIDPGNKEAKKAITKI